jgi:cell division protein ZapA (FtsZ GTPase activity inhibitor)
MQSVQIKLLGREFTLRSQQTAGQVQKVADFVEGKLKEMAAGRSVDTLDLTLLTLLNLAGQYLQLLEGREGEARELEGRLERLVLQLEAADSGC